MKFFAHSINSLNLLSKVEIHYGVEVDFRDQKGELVLGHDPLDKKYIKAEEFLKNLNGRAIIANIKSERIEGECLNLIKKYSPQSDYFFLDSSFSVIANKGKEMIFSSRFSEYESIETSINLIEANLVKWIWVDTFTKFPINEHNVDTFNSLKAKKCLTSPDLLKRSEDIDKYAQLIKKHNIVFDAICCKKEKINHWKKLLSL